MMTTENTTNLAEAGQSRLARIRQAVRDAVLHSLDTMKLATERLMGFLRLFATVGLTLIVALVVFKAIQSAGTVVVKPFAISKAVQEINPDSGRIIATQLSQELAEAERVIHSTVQGSSSEEKGRSSDATASFGNDFPLGANIKLPETGISVNDVVEFLASVFGRRTITGSIFQDQSPCPDIVDSKAKSFLHLRMELEGKVIATCRPLEREQPEKALHFDLIQAMLSEKRAALLSATLPEYNLYYYCAGKVKEAYHPASRYQAWFKRCGELADTNQSVSDMEKLIADLEQARPKKPESDADPLLDNAITTAVGRVRQQILVLCPKYDEDKTCAKPPKMAEVAVTPEIAAAVPAAVEKAVEKPVPSSWSNAYTPGDSGRVAPAPAPVVKVSLPVPLVALGDLVKIKEDCEARTIISAQEVLASNGLEKDATLLFNNALFSESVAKYQEALQQNCRNAFAWANLGVLLMSRYQGETAVFALEQATMINTRADWMPNSLCIAEAYNGPMEAMESFVTENLHCKAARELSPANRVVLDKNFYLAIADRFFEGASYDKAAKNYQTALGVDKKLDCNTLRAVSRLQKMEVSYGVKGARQAACDILSSAVPLPNDKISRCDADLKTFGAAYCTSN